MTKTICHMLAMDRSRAIGKNNDLPWRLPADMAYFRKHTIGKPVLMGRKTFDSMGKALPKRENIVVTRDPGFQAENCCVFHDLEEAIQYFKNGPNEELMIIGGAEIFRQTLPIADKLYVTEIDHEFDGDTFYPDIPPSEWKVEKRAKGTVDEENKYPHEFVVYTRK